MISKKLKIIFLLSIPLFIIHGLEEYFTGFYDIDPAFGYIISLFRGMSLNQAIFMEFQILFFLILIISFLLLQGRKTVLWTMGILGLIFIIELEHLIKTILSMSYYPGVITAFLFIPVGFFY